MKDIIFIYSLTALIGLIIAIEIGDNSLLIFVLSLLFFFFLGYFACGNVIKKPQLKEVYIIYFKKYQIYILFLITFSLWLINFKGDIQSIIINKSNFAEIMRERAINRYYLNSQNSGIALKLFSLFLTPLS